MSQICDITSFSIFKLKKLTFTIIGEEHITPKKSTKGLTVSEFIQKSNFDDIYLEYKPKDISTILNVSQGNLADIIYDELNNKFKGFDLRRVYLEDFQDVLYNSVVDLSDSTTHGIYIDSILYHLKHDSIFNTFSSLDKQDGDFLQIFVKNISKNFQSVSNTGDLRHAWSVVADFYILLILFKMSDESKNIMFLMGETHAINLRKILKFALQTDTTISVTC